MSSGRNGRIITFYSYKGGTGRTMTLANIAWILASNGRHVLVVDWDLEAPGLHRYFHPFLVDAELVGSTGVLDMVWDFVAATLDPSGDRSSGWHRPYADVLKHTFSLQHTFERGGTISVLPAGRQDEAYSMKIGSFDWSNFYDRLSGGAFIDAVRQNMAARFDYILIDSRTGLSDTAGICTVQLPDILVNCFTFSTQSITGAAAVAESVIRQRGARELTIWPVPMRVEDGETAKLNAGRDVARARLSHLLANLDPDERDRYWGEIEIPYKSIYSYEETLATLVDRPRQEGTVLAASERLTGYLTGGEVARQVPVEESERRRLAVRFERGLDEARSLPNPDMDAPSGQRPQPGPYSDETPWPQGVPLYPGLAAFDTAQARVFFGRHSESRWLADRLRSPVGPGDDGLLAVVGPSGCGKSSLVRAGLMPLLAGDPDWLVLPPLVPSVDPVAVLVHLLTSEGRRRGLDWTAGHVTATVGRPGGLNILVADLLADATPARRLLLVIDQAEELLTRTPEAARRRFATLLVEATGGAVRAVTTVRSEFLDPLATLAAETGLSVGSFLLPPLARDMLPLVITGPARHAGIRVDDELVARMVADTGGGEALPLLAYVLNQLAVGVTRSGALSTERYDTLGGVRGALSRQADNALADAAAATGRSPAEVLTGLLRLVTINADGQLTRRRVDLTGLPDHVRTELEVFVDRRLLTIHQPDADDNAGGLVIDIAHEQILTAWQPLAAAITSSADTLRLQAYVADAAAAWDRHSRPTSHLWELDRSRRAARDLNLNDLSRITQEFLAASRSHGQARRLRTTAILTVLLLLVTAGGITALVQRDRAVGEREQAAERERLATVRGLLPQAEQLRDRDIVRALRLGLAADTLASSPETLAGIEATLAATPLIATADDDQNLGAVAFSPDGRILATTSSRDDPDRPSPNGGRLRLWDLSDPHAPTSLAGVDDDQVLGTVAFSPDGRTLVTTSSLANGGGGRLRLWDVSNPRAPTSLASIDDDQVLGTVAFSPDGRTLATTSSLANGGGGRLRLWDVSNPRTPTRLGGDLHSHVHQWACGAAGGGFSEEEWDAAVPGIPYEETC